MELEETTTQTQSWTVTDKMESKGNDSTWCQPKGGKHWEVYQDKRTKDFIYYHTSYGTQSTYCLLFNALIKYIYLN